MTRIAHCCCGSLRAEVAGDPAIVGACHCTECQRRTGSPFGVGTYFPKGQVRTEGPSKAYLRGSDSGRTIELHFCPNCGSTVFWYAEFVPDLIGIAFGAFADPSMPRPTLSVWETTRHPWVTFDHQLDRFPPVADPNAKPVWHAGERANIVVRCGRISGYLINRFANVSRLCRLHSSKDLSRVAGDDDLHAVMFAQRERRGKLGSPKASDRTAAFTNATMIEYGDPRRSACR